MRTAVLLAAGEGRRLGGRKPLVRLRGRPLAWYPVSVLHLLGVAEFIVVTREQLAGELRRLVEEVAGPGSAQVVVNAEPWRENGWSLILGLREACGGSPCSAVVSMSDHVYSPRLAARLLYLQGPRGYLVGCDREPQFIDVEEATRVSATGGAVARVSKGLRRWLCVDTGVHRVERLHPGILEEAARTGGEWHVARLAGLVSSLGSAGLAWTVDVTGLPWTEVDTPEDLREAEGGERSRVVDEVLSWLHS